MPTRLARSSQAVAVSPTDLKRSWGAPELANEARLLDYRLKRYHHNWDLYEGTAFAHLSDWGDYKSVYGLYRGIRQVWDIAHEIVEFYVSHIWSGSLASDGLNLPDGVANAVPLAEDTPPKLAACIATLFKWWNFQELKDLIVRYTAAIGELLVEVDDDVEAGKVRIEMIWPGYVTDIRLDPVGNITYYCIQYTYYDRDEGKSFLFRREVDKEYIRTYRDNKPWNYVDTPIPEGTDPDGLMDGLSFGQSISNGYIIGGEDGYERPNPYGFVPARWFRHHKVMGVRGEPAIYSTQQQMDEINALMSHLLDKAHTSLESPILISGDVTPNRLTSALTGLFGSAKRAFTADLDDGRAVGEEINILEGPQGTTMSTIELKITEAGEAVDRLIKAIEKKCPEVVFYTELRAMTQVTGPSAGSLLGDVDRKVKQTAPGYDSGLRGLTQIGTAIAGMRLAEGAGGWAEKTKDQQKFAGFDLDSYAKGELDYDIMPRPLIPISAKEKLEILQMKKLVMPFIPETVIAKEAGYTDETEVQGWVDDYEEKQQQKAEDAMALAQKAPFGQSGQPGGGKPPLDIKTGQVKKPVGAPAGGPQRGAPTRNRKSA